MKDGRARERNVCREQGKEGKREGGRMDGGGRE